MAKPRRPLGSDTARNTLAAPMTFAVNGSGAAVRRQRGGARALSKAQEELALLNGRVYDAWVELPAWIRLQWEHYAASLERSGDGRQVWRDPLLVWTAAQIHYARIWNAWLIRPPLGDRLYRAAGLVVVWDDVGSVWRYSWEPVAPMPAACRLDLNVSRPWFDGPRGWSAASWRHYSYEPAGVSGVVLDVPAAVGWSVVGRVISERGRPGPWSGPIHLYPKG